MKIYKEISVRDFEPWSGAVYNFDLMTDEDKDELEAQLECMYPEGIDETQLNDILWFEDEFIANICGFDTIDELMEARG